MPSLMERGAAVAFAEPAEDFPVRANGASVFAGEEPEYERRALESETTLVRWYITLLTREVERLKEEAHSLVREIPRFQAFRQRLQRFLRSPYNEQADQRKDILASIRASSVRTVYLHEVLRQCSTAAGPNSFDIAIDLLSGFDSEVLDVVQTFLKQDPERWLRAASSHHVNDDVCYILLRALARSKVDDQTKLALIKPCLTHGTGSIREAAAHALGDMRGDAARNLLRHAAERDPDQLVRETAQESLNDLD